MNRTVNADSEIDLLADLRLIVSDMERFMTDAATVGGEFTRETRDQIGARIEAARQRIGDIESRLQSQARGAARATGEYAQAHPWQAASALGAGAFLLGLLVARRSDRAA